MKPEIINDYTNEKVCNLTKKAYNDFQKKNFNKDTYLNFNDWFTEIFLPNKEKFFKDWNLL